MGIFYSLCAQGFPYFSDSIEDTHRPLILTLFIIIDLNKYLKLFRMYLWQY